MSAAKHTPAPWAGGKDIPIRAIDQETLGFSIIFINTDSAARKDVARANARLIASAPELLDALKTFVAEYVQLVASGDAGNWDAEDEDKVKAARAAIAKAEVQS